MAQEYKDAVHNKVTILRNDEPNPAGECVFAQPMQEKPVIRCSKFFSESRYYNTKHVQNSFSETHSMHGQDIAQKSKYVMFKIGE